MSDWLNYREFRETSPSDTRLELFWNIQDKRSQGRVKCLFSFFLLKTALFISQPPLRHLLHVQLLLYGVCEYSTLYSKHRLCHVDETWHDRGRCQLLPDIFRSGMVVRMRRLMATPRGWCAHLANNLSSFPIISFSKARKKPRERWTRR